MLVMVVSMTVMDHFENEHDVPLEAHAYSAILKMGKICMMPLGG